MPGPEYFDAEWDILTGLITWRGKTYTPQEYSAARADVIEEHVQLLAELRDPTRDDQNLWGRKETLFQDDVYYLCPPIKPITGYPGDMEEDEWKPII